MAYSGVYGWFGATGGSLVPPDCPPAAARSTSLSLPLPLPLLASASAWFRLRVAAMALATATPASYSVAKTPSETCKVVLAPSSVDAK